MSPLLRFTYGCEPLESRTLLTYPVTGTAGDDVIEMSYVHPDMHGFLVNGDPRGTTPDGNIVISALGGNDRVILRHVNDGTAVTVRGGLGNDRFEVGEGNLASHLRGRVYLEELGDEGTDDL